GRADAGTARRRGGPLSRAPGRDLVPGPRQVLPASGQSDQYAKRPQRFPAVGHRTVPLLGTRGRASRRPGDSPRMAYRDSQSFFAAPQAAVYLLLTVNILVFALCLKLAGTPELPGALLYRYGAMYASALPRQEYWRLI